MQPFHFSFGQPWWLLLLPLIAWWFRRLGSTGSGPALIHSSTALLARIGRPRLSSPGRILRALRIIALILAVIALARPRVPQGEEKDPSKGIDIMLVCDISMSMNTPDFSIGVKKITRRDALVKAISEFVDSRTNDRMGMIGFAANTYILSPLTTDGNWIKEVLKMVQLRGGTAIGDGLFNAVDKLSENPTRSKVIVLATDGLNNAGRSPFDAAEYAKKKGVRIYALEIMSLRNIHAGAALKSPLAEVAIKTGGQHFQASDTEALMQIYRQIDRMEKREVDQKHFLIYHELFPWLTIPAFLLLLFEWIAAHTFWMRLP